MGDPERDYLLDLGLILRESAVLARQRATEARGTPEESYEEGRAMAYHEVATLLIKRAAAFGLPPESLRLEGFDPDREY
jgi:hypothetical protein